MLITHNREKLINAIIYFSGKLPSCGKTKLFKLLYILDFEHYAQTGRSVTGLDYYAWKMGPVPVSLFEELEEPQPDFSNKISIKSAPNKISPNAIEIFPKSDFNASLFTKRELALLEEISEGQEMSTADDLIRLTHSPSLPWHRVYEIEKRKNQQIPYEYRLSDSDVEISDAATEHEEIISNYK